MKTVFRNLIGVVCTAVTLTCAAQGYPAKPIRLVVPFPAGGTVDGVARILGAELATLLGQPIIVDNKSGANGRIGTADVARAAPGGYTMLMVYDNYATDPIVYKDLPYDPWKDLVPVSLVARTPLIAIAPNAFPPNDIKQLVGYAKANPGKVDFGSAGVGSSSHLAGELFASATGTQMLHVPYKGGATLQTDLLSGNLKLLWATAGFAKTLHQTGKVKLLGQAGRKRSSVFPNVETLQEQGFSSIEINAWIGLMAPAGTPAEIIARWQTELAKAARVPAVATKLSGLGFDVVMSSSEEFRTYWTSEHSKWAQLIKTANIPLQ